MLHFPCLCTLQAGYKQSIWQLWVEWRVCRMFQLESPCQLQDVDKNSQAEMPWLSSLHSSQYCSIAHLLLAWFNQHSYEPPWHHLCSLSLLPKPCNCVLSVRRPGIVLSLPEPPTSEVTTSWRTRLFRVKLCPCSLFWASNCWLRYLSFIFLSELFSWFYLVCRGRLDNASSCKQLIKTSGLKRSTSEY